MMYFLNHTSESALTHQYLSSLSSLCLKIACSYGGAQAQYFLQRYIPDILINFTAQHADAQQPFVFESMVHTDTCHNIFNYLASHPHKIHSLPALAYMYEINQAEMEHCFHQHFAISIHDYMQMLRMMMTWHLVQSKASQCLK